jgi:hypothetical protein
MAAECSDVTELANSGRALQANELSVRSMLAQPSIAAQMFS